MRRLILAGLAALSFAAASPAAAQEVQRYVGQNRRPQAVDDANRLPVANGVTSNPDAALDSRQTQAGSGGVIFTGRGNFYSATITLASGQGPGFLMVFDSATIPADGAVVPMRCFYVDAGPRTISFGSAIPLGMDNGLVWAFSSGANCQTKTAATANFVAVSYKEE